MVDKKIMDYKFKSIQSHSHLMGNITSLVIDYIKNAFDRDFFKTVRVTTEVPFAERQRWKESVRVKARPMMIIDPKLDPGTDSQFLPGIESDVDIANDTSDDIWVNRHQSSFMEDPEDKYRLYNSSSRYVMNFGIKCIFDSDIQKIEAMDYIRHSIRHRIPIQISRYIEQHIPSHFMEAIALMEDMDINSDEFLTHVNTISRHPISHRVRPGSGNKEFFILTPTMLTMVFDSLPSDAGTTRRGKVKMSSSFVETIRVEFPAFNMYYLRTNTDISKSVEMGLHPSKGVIQPVSMIDFVVFKFPTFNDYLDNFKKFTILNVQFNDDHDELNISPFLSGEVLRVVEYHKNNNIDIDFLKILISEEGEMIDRDRYSLNQNTQLVNITGTDLYKAYSVGIYVDYKYINDMKLSLYANDDYEQTIGT